MVKNSDSCCLVVVYFDLICSNEKPPILAFCKISVVAFGLFNQYLKEVDDLFCKYTKLYLIFFCKYN